MGIKGKSTTAKNNFPSMIKNLKMVNGSAVEVGVLKGEHKWLAGIHEYGLDIEVTPAMRAYLHGQGLHLKDSTTHIHIPERAFLRTGYDQNRDKVLQKAQMVLQDVVAGKVSAAEFYEAVGSTLRDAIKKYAIELDSPPNHPFTIDRKGSSNPLVKSGDMIEGIIWRKAK